MIKLKFGAIIDLDFHQFLAELDFGSGSIFHEV